MPARDHHVDLIRPLADRKARILELRRKRVLAGGKARRHRRHLDARAVNRFPGSSHQHRIDAHRRHVRDIGQVVRQVRRLVAHLANLPLGVRPFQRRQVDHRKRELQRVNLGVLLDRALGQTLNPLLDPHLIDGQGPSRIRHLQRACGHAAPSMQTLHPTILTAMKALHARQMPVRALSERFTSAPARHQPQYSPDPASPPPSGQQALHRCTRRQSSLQPPANRPQADPHPPAICRQFPGKRRGRTPATY